MLRPLCIFIFHKHSSNKIKRDLTMQDSLDRKIAFHMYESIFVLALVGVCISFLVWDLMLPRMDFYNELWAPAYQLVHGQRPYDTASLHPNLPAAWLPMVIGLFFPLGWLSEESSLEFWYFFNILEVCLVVYIAQGKNRSLYNTAVLALLCFFFPLTLNHINLGQFSITVTLCWILAAYFMEEDQRWLSAFCAAVALSKPHLGYLLLLGFSYKDYLRGGIREMLSSWMRIVLMCVILCIPLFVAYPNWIPDAIVSMGKNPPWSYPSLYILFERFFHVWGYILWGFTTLTVIGVNFLLWRKLPMKNAAYWSLALAPIVTPYVGSWDFVVLFPLLISTYVNGGWRQRTFLLIVYFIAWFGMARIQMLAVSHNHYFWWVPLWFIVSIALVSNSKVKPEE